MRHHVLLGALASFASFAQGKVLSGVIKLDGEVPEHYISKFSINSEGTVQGTLKTETGEKFTSGSVSLFMYNAEDWPQYAKEVTCMDRARLAKHRFSIGSKGKRELSVDEEMRNTYQLHEHESSFSFEAPMLLDEGEVWYVVIADCSLEQIYHNIPPIQYDISLLNGGGHNPAEEYGLNMVYLGLLVFLAVGGIYAMKLARDQYDTLGQLHLIMKLLLFAFLLNWLATAFEAAHLWIYTATGTGSATFNKISEMTAAMFSVTVNFVLLALACGWTLTETSDTSASSVMDTFKNPSKLFQWAEVGGIKVPSVLATPSSLLVLIMMGSYVCVEFFDVLTSNQDDDFSKFHEHDSMAGYILMAMHVIFCLLFWFTIAKTMKNVPPRLRDFCKQLLFAGTLWFWTTPILVAIAPFFDMVIRHRLVTGGTIFLQSTSLLVMVRLFLSSSSEYYKFSTIANNGTMLGLSGVGPAQGRATGKAID